MHCGRATPTDPGVPPRTTPTGAIEVATVKRALSGTYPVERVVGEGGMATVYLAEDVKHHRRVALKVMRAELAATLGTDRFLREVSIAAQLNHPHILPMHDSGEADGILYYVMPFVEGESLASRLQREGTLSIPEAVRLAREVAEALAYAHKRGIVHRDIKPANILLSEGHALVADFGIARALGSGGEAITKTGLAVGTPQYMSPEQATGAKEVDGRTDIYALGAVLYEMLTGEPPFTGRSAQAVIARSLTERPRPVSASRDGLSPALEQLVMQALARNASDRPPSAATFAESLATIEGTLRGGAPSLAPAAPSGSSVASHTPAGSGAWVGAGVVVMLTLSGMAFLAGRWGLPTWSLWLALALIVVGAAMIALTARAEGRRRSGTSASLDRLFTWRTTALGGVAALVLWAGASGFAASRRSPSSASSSDGARMAVLPFENLGATDDAYFADGIADEVRGKLSRVKGLIVTASTSASQYKASKKEPREIANELGVNYLLVGRVRWAGTGSARRVQVIPEVIDARTGSVTWQQTFDANVTDVFKVQGDIAARVAAAIGVALGAEDQAKLAQRPTDNLAAYDAYLKGLANVGQDPASLHTQVAHLEQAVRLDTGFVKAWSLLARRLATLYNNSSPDPAVAERSRVAADRAAALDSSGVEGHIARAAYYQTVRHNAALAYEEIQPALRSTPNDVDVLIVAGQVERALGRVEEALLHLQQAHRLDPRSIASATRLQAVLLWTRRYKEALAVSEEALALAPGDLSISQDKSMVYVAQGDLAGARGVLRQISPAVSPSELEAFFGNYWDMYWLLDDAQQRHLLTLGSEPFDKEPATQLAVQSAVYWLRGDSASARRLAAQELGAIDQILAKTPDDYQRHGFKGLMFAYLGRRAESVASLKHAMELAPISVDAQNGPYVLHLAARSYVALGDANAALDALETLLKVPYFLSPGWLRVDPTWNPLRGNPRFEKLIASS